MSPEMEALRSHKGVVASVIAAAIGFTLFCLVGIAVLLGWIGPGVRPLTAPAPAPATRAPAHDMGLSPGETVVAAADAPVASSAPAKPPPPANAPAVVPASPPKTAMGVKHHRNAELAAATRTAPPQPARKEFTPAPESRAPSIAAAPHPSDPTDPWPQPACGACGVVHSIITFPDLWEVRVRFDDGGRRTIRYHKPPRWRVGDRIRYEGGRLQPE